MPKSLRDEILETKVDFYKYCDKNLKIRNKAGQIIPLGPNINVAQKELADYVIECLVKGQPVRAIVLKARQEGLSTIIEAIIYWWTATHRNIEAKIIAHKTKASNKLYKMFQRYYDNSEELYKPMTHFRTKAALTFATKDGGGLQSEIDTATAENIESGRSETVQLVHGSEVAFWRDAEEIMSGLMQAVPLLPDTMIFLESTANGAAGYFYEEWQAAKEGESSFKPFFFPWYIHDEYRLKTEPLTDLSEEEFKWKKSYGITDEQIAWYRLKNKELKKRGKMKQEYPFNDTEAFLASGRPRFDIEKVVEMEKMILEPEYLDIFEQNEQIRVAAVEGAPFKVWERPKDNRRYTIGVDTAEGLDRGDLSVADIMDKDSMETVARWRGQIEPHDFGELLELIGRWYNKALIGVEVNNHGLTVIQRLRDMRYDNLFRRERGLDERLETATSKLGWRTDVKTKPLMIDSLAEAILSGRLKEHDPVFIKEAKTYIVTERGKTEAQQGSHDDVIMAKAINLQLFEWSHHAAERHSVRSRYSPKLLAKKQRNRRLVKKRTVGVQYG